MKTTTIQAKIEELFQSDLSTKKDELKTLIDALLANHGEAVQTARRAFLSFILFWGAFYAIGNGMIQEVQISALKIGSVGTILVVGPAVLGALFYFLCTSIAASSYLDMSIGQIFKYYLPKAYELDLDMLTAPPTIFRVEGFLDTRSSSKWLNRSSKIWIATIMGLILVGCLIAIVHVSVLMWRVAPLPTYQRVTSNIVGGLFWLRGISVLIITGQIAPRNL